MTIDRSNSPGNGRGRPESGQGLTEEQKELARRLGRLLALQWWDRRRHRDREGPREDQR
jgi:hypothetical protein